MSTIVLHCNNKCPPQQQKSVIHLIKIDNWKYKPTDLQQWCRLSVGLLFPKWIPQALLGALLFVHKMSQGQVIDIMTFNSSMSQWLAIDIMTYNSYSLQYYSFWKGKIGFGFLKHEDRFLFLGPCQFTPDVTVWQFSITCSLHLLQHQFPYTCCLPYWNDKRGEAGRMENCNHCSGCGWSCHSRCIRVPLSC